MKYVLIITILLYVGCGSFEPYKDINQPQSCNDKITYMKLIVKTNGMFNKEGTVAFLTLLTLADNDCKKDRLLFRKVQCFDKCVKIIYGDKLLPSKENYKKYTEFSDLLKKCE